MLPSLEDYRLTQEDAGIVTPALLLYPAAVDMNIRAMLRLVGGDANRWRPHIKTFKMPQVVGQLLAHGVSNFKCATTLELKILCDAGAQDVLLAFPVVGTTAERVTELAAQFPRVGISVLVDSAQHLEQWRETNVDIFLDLNAGMNRTGVSADDTEAVITLAKKIEATSPGCFRGLHFYEGAVQQPRYERLLQLVDALERASIRVKEVITSGTPGTPAALEFAGFARADFTHRVSPGTVVLGDLTSLEQLPAFGFRPAALVLGTVVSHPLPEQITADVGHKSISVDTGVPHCVALEWPELTPQAPSEEHLPLKTSGRVPALGERLYFCPRHICPTVNLFDYAVCVVDGRITGTERVAARGHELQLAGEPTIVV